MTDANLASTVIIILGPIELLPEIPIVSEGGEKEVSGERFWLVDPLDDTKDLTRGLPEFKVNTALIENQRPVLGIVHLPMSGQTYVVSSEGAWKYWNGETIPLKVSIRERDPRNVTSRSHLDSETEEFTELFKEKYVP